MSTALLHHHQRSHLIAVAAVVLAVAALIGFNVANDDAPASPGDGGTSTVQQFKLTGGTHEQGNWNHAGTASGGHAPRTLAP